MVFESAPMACLTRVVKGGEVQYVPYYSKPIDNFGTTNTFLPFIFESNGPCAMPANKPQVFVIAKSCTEVDYSAIEDSLSPYMESDCADNEAESIVRDIMDNSGLDWVFAKDAIPECKAMHAFWV